MEEIDYIETHNGNPCVRFLKLNNNTMTFTRTFALII